MVVREGGAYANPVPRHRLANLMCGALAVCSSDKEDPWDVER